MEPFSLSESEDAAVWAMLAREQDAIERAALADGESWWSDRADTEARDAGPFFPSDGDGL